MLNNNEFLIKAINTAIATRKVKKISISQEFSDFNPRPQMHVMVVSPFGTAKSTGIGRTIMKMLNGDCVYKDDFSKAGFLGSINKQGEYVRGIVMDLGGKVLIVDEWNSVNWEAQKSLLGILEQQMISRQMGFAVRRSVSSLRKDEFCNIKVKRNLIEGRCQFSSVAFAMQFASHGLTSLALMSRFCPIFLKPNINEIKEILKGIKKYNFVNSDKVIENVVIHKKDWSEYVDSAAEYLVRKGVYPREHGFFTRAVNEVVRFSITDAIKEQENDVLHLDLDVLKRHLPFIEKQIFMFQMSKTTLDRFKDLVFSNQGMTDIWYAEQLGVSKQYVGHLKKKIESQGLYVDMVKSK